MSIEIRPSGLPDWAAILATVRRVPPTDTSLRPDVFIAALGRSGSTLLANLLTTPPGRWVMIEPRVADNTTGLDLIQQAISFGLPVSVDEWSRHEGESHRERFHRVFGDRLRQLDRWGLKEVRPDLLLPSYRLLRPRKSIILVRDIRDAAVSLVEKTERDADPRYDETWIRRYLTSSPAAVLALLDSIGRRDCRVVRYEELVVDARARSDLASWLDWPLDGDPKRHLAEIYNRAREAILHAGVVTDRALRRRTLTTSPRAIEIANWAAVENVEFQRRFGYTL